jgi:hypothetical protein
MVRPGFPDREAALQRRTVEGLIAEELRRLDPDDVYGETLAALPELAAWQAHTDHAAPAATVAPAKASRTAPAAKAPRKTAAVKAPKKAASPPATARRGGRS